MASVSGDYGEDWEEEEPSVSKETGKSAADQQSHSMEDDTRDPEPTQVAILGAPHDHNPPAEPSKVLDEKFKSMGTNENAVADTSVISEEVPTSEDTRSSIEGEKTISTDPADTIPGVSNDSPDLDKRKQFLDLVQIHGMHCDHKTLPPAPFKVSIADNSTEVKSPPKPSRGALQARVAAKRVMEFRRRQAIKEEELRALESAWTQKRREIRRSNDPMHRELGVAGLSAQDHLRMAQRRRKAKAKQEEHAASFERQNRWYNSIPKRTASASDHVRELNLQYRQAKHEQKRTIRLQQKSIQLRQLELRQKAHDIIIKNQGEYVHGSYLLKVSTAT
ncbi:hypothetical protein ON010_g4320 [Phytophthora cinnamomi]|nr:hypothetical protein ON010_g4320 [Phytophthora cinnamomi]